MKGYSLCTFLDTLGGCLAVEELYVNTILRSRYRSIMKGYSLCTFLVIRGGCLAVEELYVNTILLVIDL